MQVTSDESATDLPLILPIAGDSAAGYCECLIKGKFQRGTLVRLLAIFESRGIKVLNCAYDSDAANGTFGATLTLQLEKESDSETLTLVEKLMETKMVSTIEFAPLKGKAFGTFRFPVILMPGDRGVVVQATSLSKSFRETANLSDRMIQDVGISYGRTFARQALSKKKSVKQDEIVLQILRASGWGTGKLEENAKGEITFILKDPVIGLESEGDGDSRFLIGMIQGMLEEAFSCAFRLLQDRFDGKTNSLVLRLLRSSTSS